MQNLILVISGRLLALTKCEIKYRDNQTSQVEQTLENTRIAAFGGSGQGLWFSVMDNLHLCRGPQIDSICGHYVEWGGQSSDPAVALAHRSQIDVGKHREYCQLE